MTNTHFTRRSFLQTSALSAGLAASAPLWASETKKASLPSSTDILTVGKTGVKVSRIAQGTGANGYNRQSDQTRLGMERFIKQMRHAYDSGIRFFDLADLYGSHPYFKNALQEIPRDELTILTKVWFAGGGGMPKTDTALPAVERFKQEIGTDVLDIVLIHCVTNSRWPEQQKRMREELSELKEKGTVRAVGCSCHSLDALKTAAEDPWVDVIFSRINDKQKKMDGAPGEVAPVLKKARANGKFVVGMKIYGCGDLTSAEYRDQSLRYVIGSDLVDAMTIGFDKTEQVDDTMEHVTRVLRA
ncbi:MAG: aldo/keto reductase [Candidatus Omnitrophica bacterium]|nr:aldo/keto reductase [Candidatus Omnitrophota bacterium]